VSDLVAVDAYLEPVQASLDGRARGGGGLDAFKVVLVTVSLVVTLPIALLLLFASDAASFPLPPLRWPWRRVDDIVPDITAAKSALAATTLDGRDELYAVLDRIEDAGRPTHRRSRALAEALRTHRRALRVHR
jgi:hypothetical protein